jgi:hypothetical protein
MTNGPLSGRDPDAERDAPGSRRVSSFDEGRCQPPILNIFVLQTGQTPCVAGLPFFMVIFVAFSISRFALHLTQ